MISSASCAPSPGLSGVACTRTTTSSPSTSSRSTEVPFRVSVDTFPNEWFHGHIGTISSQGEYTPRNVQTRAQRAEQVFGVKVLVDPNLKLKAGMAANVDFGVKGRAD